MSISSAGTPRLRPYRIVSIADVRTCKTVVICPHRATMTEVAPLLAEVLPLAPMQKLHAYPDRKEATELLRTFEAKVCFLDFASNGESGFATLEILQSVAPALMVVGLLSGGNSDLVLRCLRGGAADFLVAPYTADQVEAVIEKLGRRIPASDANSAPARIVAVMPAKGGAGASTLALNLAYHCKKLGAERALLADLDGLTGSVAFLLKAKSSYSFLDVLQYAGGLDADIWKQMVTGIRGVDVLLAPDSGVDPTAGLASAAPIFNHARYAYDVVVADCGGVVGDWNLSIAQMSDDVLVVAGNEAPDIHAACRSLAYLETYGVSPARMRLVINRYSTQGGLNKEQIGTALEREIYYTVPLDEQAFEQAQMDGKPLASGSQAYKSLAALAARIYQDEEKPEGKSKPKSGGIFSLLSRS